MKIDLSIQPKIVLLTLCAQFSGHAYSADKTTPERPNLLIVMADQWRGTTLGFRGVEPVKTPNIDRLAKEGVYFSNAVSNYPVSSPARAMLMTGMYPTKTNVRTNCNTQSGPFGCELSEKQTCWSDILAQNGYALGYIGKWHLDTPYKPYVPTANNTEKEAWNEWTAPNKRHGFSHWIAYGTYDNHLKPMYWTTNAPRDSFQFVNQWGPEFEVDNAMQYIRNVNGRMRDDKKPFALVVSMNPPHTGYSFVPDKYKALYKDMNVEDLCIFPDIPAKGTTFGDYYRANIKDYYACMSGVDDQIGRLMSMLKEQGLDQNTIVVFMSDHGDCVGMHQEVSKNNYYEESMRIPLIIRYPKKIQPKTSDIYLSLLDITATLLDWTGGLKQVGNDFDGVSYRKLIETGKGKKPKSQLYFKMSYYPDEAKDEGVRLLKVPQQEFRGIRTQEYKFAIRFEKREIKEYVLFDRKNDPYELHNIADQEPKLVKKYKKELIKKLTPIHDWILPYIK
jgi:arylsulfatase A-like enzyme